MREIIAAGRGRNAQGWLAYGPLLGAVGLSLALRGALLAAGAVPFNSDEAVVGLMARHILRGAWPVFFYGQAYMGSLDAWLVAAAFRVFGEAVWPIRLVQVALYTVYLVLLWRLARAWFPDRGVADVAVWLAALPPVLVTTYTTASLGGYGESLVLGVLSLGLGWRVTQPGRPVAWAEWVALGLAAGAAFWTLGLALVYLLPVGLWAVWVWRGRVWRPALAAGLGFAVGSAPFWLYNVTHAWAAVRVLLGLDGPAGGVTLGLLERVIGLLFLGLPAVVGMRAPWEATYFPWPVVGGLAVAYAAALWHQWRHRPPMADGARPLLALMGLCFAGLFLFTGLGRDATGRYFLPLCLPATLLLAEAVRALWRRRAGWGAATLAGVIAAQLAGNGLAAAQPDGLTTQFDPRTRWGNAEDAPLIAFLEAEDLTRGYTNYWVAFRLAFLSGERLIYTADLPYKPEAYSPADNRYPPYVQLVADSAEAAYITTRQPELDAQLRLGLSRLGVAYEETVIGVYRVFHGLSRRVTPAELGLP